MNRSLTLSQKKRVRNAFDNMTTLLEMTRGDVDAILSCEYSRLPTELLEEYVWQRISLMFRICTAVSILLGEKHIVGDRVKTWLSSPNQAFSGESARDYLVRDPVSALVRIQNHLESALSGDYH